MRIGIDVDGVLSEFQTEFVNYVSTVKGYEHCTIDKIHPTWHFYQGWMKDGQPMATEEFLRLFHAGVDDGHIFSRAEPVEGAVEATHRLHEAGHSVHIITDCNMGTHPGASQRARVVWLAKHGFYFDSITFSADKTCVKTDLFIDDKVENYLALWEADTFCYLADRPWNQTDNPAWPERFRHGFQPYRTSGIVEFVDEVLMMEEV